MLTRLAALLLLTAAAQDDTADILNLIPSEKEDGVTEAGSVDLLWVNGKNFRAMTQGGLAFCGYPGILPNDALVNWDNAAIVNDFGVPAQGCELPRNGSRPCRSSFLPVSARGGVT